MKSLKFRVERKLYLPQTRTHDLAHLETTLLFVSCMSSSDFRSFWVIKSLSCSCEQPPGTGNVGFVFEDSEWEKKLKRRGVCVCVFVCACVERNKWPTNQRSALTTLPNVRIRLSLPVARRSQQPIGSFKHQKYNRVTHEAVNKQHLNKTSTPSC